VTVRVVVLGDVLLDRDIEGEVRRIMPDAPAPVVEIGSERDRAGGAGLAAVLLDRQGISVELLTALADDEPAKRLLNLLTQQIPVTSVLTSPGTRCKMRIRSGGQSLLRMDVEASPSSDGSCDVAALEAALEEADALLVSDYGGGVTSHPQVRRVLREWAGRRPMVWDPHPRGADPVVGATVVTPNKAEAVRFGTVGGEHPDRLAMELRDRWQAWSVAVTDGGNGVFTASGGAQARFTPVPFRYRGDSCGAGDRFAGTVAAELGAGATTSEAVEAAVQDTADWLAAGGVQAPPDPAPATRSLDADAVVRRVRAAGGTVVATGGCFDILHAGHIASLEAARSLGDALVVLLNSDDSVRRLKGDGRPVNSTEDRCRVLSSLRCVDAVVVFDDDDPRPALQRLRPDVWAKGGDYTAEMLPENPLVTSWGGRVVLMPYLPGRSTTAILEKGSTR
jgi:rfaE bifunctional protein nucleotidyltransferase chain/domain/rfaE bifunctional protein kinase chain/domain